MEFTPHFTSGARVEASGNRHWQLEIPAGPAGHYRLAQLDDYTTLLRARFPWQPPIHLVLQARASAPDLPGTWGFGLWNDPFSLSLGFGGGAQRFPSLPNAAWFFFASPPNYLSFRDDLPAQGFLAATFRSIQIPMPLLAASSLGLPLFLLPGMAQLLRRAARQVIKQASSLVEVDVTTWHTYDLYWQAEKVSLAVDGQVMQETPISPRAPLGLVLWIDNQFAALPPGGRLKYGFLPNPQPAWIELDKLEISNG